MYLYIQVGTNLDIALSSLGMCQAIYKVKIFEKCIFWFQLSKEREDAIQKEKEEATKKVKRVVVDEKPKVFRAGVGKYINLAAQ